MILEYILQINLRAKRTPTFGTACIGMKVDGDLHPQVMTVLLLMTLHRFQVMVLVIGLQPRTS